ncbi:hypothetical protein CJO97_03485 [Ralstonia solanacearum]|nr:hypothetical protein CJO85_03510 [Ralstonia solanacearum]AXW75027.1 hypothetical protein CJO97_03485 [Ralstonia solanacearum]
MLCGSVSSLASLVSKAAHILQAARDLETRSNMRLSRPSSLVTKPKEGAVFDAHAFRDGSLRC